MKKIPKNKIPSALLEWSDNLNDFWLARFIRSMGYTRDELVEIANKNNKIKRALRIAVDSLIDKIFFCVTAEYFNPDFADFLLIYYLKNFDFVKNDKVIDINFGGGKLLNEKN